MISFSWGGNFFKSSVFSAIYAWVLGLSVLAMPVYGIIHNNTGLSITVLNYFMRGCLFLAYLSILIGVLSWNYLSRIVDVYLPYDTESMSKSQFMEYVKTGNIRYVNDTVNTRYIRTMTFNLTKEEYNLLTLRMASKELSSVKYKVDRAK